MDGFPKAAAVECRVLYPQDEGHHREESDHNRGGDGEQLAENPGDQRSSRDRLDKGKQHPDNLGGGKHKCEVEELQVFGHDQSRAHRVHKLEGAGHEENETDQKCRKTPCPVMELRHRRASTALFIFENMLSGSSISPRASEQSMRRNVGSWAHWVR